MYYRVCAARNWRTTYVKIATLNVPETWGFVIRVSEVDSSRSKRVAQWAPPEALINIFAKLKITLNM